MPWIPGTKRDLGAGIIPYDMSPQCRGCAGVLISRLNRACIKGPLNSASNHLHVPVNINQNGCNLVVNSHVLGQGRINKLSYQWGRGACLTDALVVFYLLFTECSN